MRTYPRSILTLAVTATAALLVPASVTAGDDTTVLHAGMNGSRELPGPGSPSASGQARISVNASTGEICWDLRVQGIDGDVVAAHIHVGDRSVPGPVVLPLTPPVGGTSSGCATNAALADALLANPSGYYVNVHSTEFPLGAVRGQLAGAHS